MLTKTKKELPTKEDLVNFEKEIKVEAGETIRISFSVYAPMNTEMGFYDGDISIVVVPA